MDVIYRLAEEKDLDEVFALQQRYHVDTISEEDKPDGFVTTLFTTDQLRALMEQEQGVSIAVSDGKVIGYAMAGSWEFWSEWPLFEYMIERLNEDNYCGDTMTVENSYQYGPICVDKEYRGTGVFQGLFWFSLKTMADKYPYMLTFINQINPRSYKAHTEKVGMDVIKTFEFNDNDYWELGIPTEKVKEKE